MGNEWIVERDLVDLLNSTLGMDVFMSIAPENAKEPFAVLSTVNIGAVRPLSFFHPLFQLDAFASSPQEAITDAEGIISKINGTDAEYGSTLFDSIRAERASLLRVEDGSWKAVIEITANCIRREKCQTHRT